MFVSKHHYAAELARAGNTVYFINGPDQENKLRPGEIRIQTSEIEGLFLLEHRLFFPYIIKFKAAALYRKLIKVHINRIVKKVRSNVDLVWSFDLSNTIPLKYFTAGRRIFMPVDEPLHRVAIEAAEGAEAIFSVTEEILHKYTRFAVPKHFINHGVQDVFINRTINENTQSPIRVGLSGNMLRKDIDRAVLITIIKENESVVFDIWGTTNIDNSNLIPASGVHTDSIELIATLKSLKNVNLYGQLPPAELATALKERDAFLICYDINKDQSKGTNYHKIMEYLATGKVVISNNVTTYKNYPGLIEMTESRVHNEELLALFKKVISEIRFYNSYEKQHARIKFAEQATYRNQIKKIGNLLNAMDLKPA